MKSKYIGVKTNNLKNINVVIPQNKTTLIIGTSGSGKSSLAIDTINNISLNELNQLIGSNDYFFNYSIDEFTNILPSVCLIQNNYNRNPRSTVGTYFGLDTFIKNLYSIRNIIPISKFQFNCYDNACKKCLGTGVELKLDPSKIIDYDSNLKSVPFLNWKGVYLDFYKKLLSNFCKDNNIDIEKKISMFDNKTIDLLLYGEGEKKYKIEYKSGNRKRVKTTVYIGPLNNKEIFSSLSKKKYSIYTKCSSCNGFRFSESVLQYKLYDKNIGELYTTEISILSKWIIKHKHDWSSRKNETFLFNNLLSLIDKFIGLNLNYIYLNRSIPSLSGGELQRLRLSKALNTHFNNFIYILDEPSSGLHPCEIKKIADSIVELKEKKNTVILIEHNDVFKKISDNTIILGPSGGEDGGYIIKKQINSNIINKYIFFKSHDFIKITNETQNNIVGLSANIPLGTLVSICGASGSGKSSFLSGILPKYLKKTISLNQTPLKGNSYSIVASYIGIIETIREIFANQFKLKSIDFSFHHMGAGKCHTCNGSGTIDNKDSYGTSSMMTCPACNGMRFNKKTLSFTINNMNIYDFLDSSIDMLIPKIYNKKEFKKVTKTLDILSKLGLGHLTLFRNLTTLSGGESQRVKICKSLLVKRKNYVYLLDEPLRGVDTSNAHRIMELIYNLVEDCNSVFIVEHNLIAINSSSYILEFGPMGGKFGGQLLYNGKKSDISRSDKSIIKNFIEY